MPNTSSTRIPICMSEMLTTIIFVLVEQASGIQEVFYSHSIFAGFRINSAHRELT